MDYTYIKDDQTVKLNDKFKAELVGSIPKKYDQWDDAREDQRRDTKKLREEIYGRKYETTEKGKEWKSHVELTDIYEKRDTLKAHLWANIYQNPDSMIDVSGRDPQAEQQAPIQKANLVNAFENMKVQFELDKMVDNLIETGDMALFVGWETKTKSVRRAKTKVEKMQDRLTAMFSAMTNPLEGALKFSNLLGATSNFVTYDELLYEGATVKAVDPLNFVFDAANIDDWDRCGKIYRTFANYGQIANNKAYKISKTDLADLKNMAEEDSQETNNNLENDYDDKAKRGNQLEILEYWGDITLSDDTVLHNWLIVVAGRSKIIRFETNPYVINPFVFGNVIDDPNTKRGISPLRIMLAIDALNQEVLNTKLDIKKLQNNPPYLAPKGAMNGAKTVSPGKIIEYDAALMPNAPVPITFTDRDGWEFLQFFQQMQESATGINKFLSGDIQGGNVDTATEAQGLMSGGNTRMALIVDTVNMKMIVPMTEKVADLLANFKTGVEDVPTKVGGIPTFQSVTDDVRQANYKYTYGDRKAMFERKQKFKEMLQFATQLLSDPILNQAMNHIELAKFGFEQLGVDNTERFFNGSGQTSMGNIPINAGQGTMGVNPPVLEGLPVQPNQPQLVSGQNGSY